MTPSFKALLSEIRTAHATHPKLAAFVRFPDDLVTQTHTPRHFSCSDVMRDDPVFQSSMHPLSRAFYDAGPDAHWRETYANTNIGSDFLDRFGCYCAIGEGGQWTSKKMAGFVVTMPPGLYYPWHHHPAEEMYLVLAGEAVFHRDGAAAENLCEGEAVFHSSNQPHAMQTFDHPVMAYVTWRNHLGIRPVLTERGGDIAS